MRSITTLQQKLQKFYIEREWGQFHDPKNLIMALNGELGELTELFQWLTPEQAKNIMQDPDKAKRVKEELADVFVYLISLSDKLDIDLIDAAYQKIEVNAQKYPVEKAKGNAKKYSDLT